MKWSLLLLCAAGSAQPVSPDGWARALRRELSQPRVQWILMDARSRQTLDRSWADLAAPAPFGSLIKPFTALAYGERHSYRFPDFECRGANACWDPRGHGRIGLEEAIAFSCNSWFRQLAETLVPSDVEGVLDRFGLRPPALLLTADALVGYGDQWRFPAEAMAAAYCELMDRRTETGVVRIVRGMELSAARGTAAGLGVPAAAKTGTAPCRHHPAAPADGYVLAVFDRTPARSVLFVQVHGVTGAQAASVVGRALRRMNAGGR